MKRGREGREKGGTGKVGSGRNGDRWRERGESDGQGEKRERVGVRGGKREGR